MASGVEFDEDKITYGTPRPSSGGMGNNAGGGYSGGQSQKGMIGWLIRHGWVRSENTAQAFLIGVVTMNIIITFIVVTYFL